MPIYLEWTAGNHELLETTFHNDGTPDEAGDFMFIHSDCTSYYNAEKIQYNATFATTDVNNRPGANCDPIDLDSTNTGQTIVVDNTPPAVNFDWPLAAGPTTLATAGVGVQFDATDAVAGFDATHSWSLQRRKASWSGSVCNAFSDDGSAVTGASVLNPNSLDQVVSQGLLADGTCYQWTLVAVDANGNASAAINSGVVRVDTSGVLGRQSQSAFEDWDLGAGDSLSVNAASGDLLLTHPVVSLPVRGGSVSIDLSYDRQDPSDVGMTPGWRLNMLRRLTINADNSVTLADGTGARHTFTPTGTVGTVTSYARPNTAYATLVKDTSVSANEFVLTYRDGSRDKFDISGSSGLLVGEEDRFANGVTLAYTSGQLTSIVDTAGSRTISLAWTSGNLTSVTDWANLDGSGNVTSSGSGNRTSRFFYAGGQLVGWADPFNTSGSCSTGQASHLTCLTYAGTGSAAGVTSIAKTQTYETFSAGTLGSLTRTVTTGVTYAGADVDTVTDAEGAATTFRHTAPFATKVIRPGTPASETTYTRLGSVDDAYGRIGSVKRKVGAGAIDTTTTYDATYPIEPLTVSEDASGSLARSTTYSYVASSMGLVSRVDEPLDGTYRHYTDYTYNTNNDVTQSIESRQGDASLRTTTRYCYSSSSCGTSDHDPNLYRVIANYVNETKGGANGHLEDVTTEYQVDSYGQRTGETRYDYAPGGTLLDSAATGWTYDALGNQTAEIRNYASGTVTSPGDDVTPNSTTNARTDLTTAFGYDTGGNRVSVADPRRAIESALGTSLSADDYVSRTAYDALGRSVVEQLPTTPSGGDCTPASATCRQSQTTYDELGLVREAKDVPDVVTPTTYNKVGRVLATYEDPPPAGSASQTSASTYDAAGRLLTTKDRLQVGSAGLGLTAYTYDELGRIVTTVEASGSSPSVATTTKTVYDDLGRKTCEQVGWTSGTCEAAAGTGQTTLTTYDPGDRPTKVDDEFTCTSTAYDWRGLATTIVEGQASGSCTGSGTRTTTDAYDDLGRLTSSSVSGGDVLEAPTYDSVGNQLSTSATTASVTTSSAFTLNPLDQVMAETRSDGGTATSWARTNYDPKGNATDRCVWNTSPGSESCKAVGQTFTTTPAVNTTTAYDARDNRVSLKVPGIGETTYDAAHNYAIDKVYVPTKLDGSGQVIAEHLTDYGYDSRHRLLTISDSVCPVTAGTHTCSGTLVPTATDTYGYDDNDNRTSVAESRDGSTTVTTTYCYDALNRLTAAKLTTSCATSPFETNAYDTSGNRTQSVVSGVTTNFAYNAAGQLCKTAATACTSPNVTYDSAGRTSSWNGWTLTYDGEGRLASACKVAGCASGDKVTMRYDGDGRRIELVTRPSGGSTTTTTFRYQGSAITQELTGGTVAREYVTDDDGRIVKVCDPSCASPTTTYLVTWNGHGDALGLWRINSDGTLTLANSYSYSTWGAPTTTVASGFSDLKFRFLYVGAADVQWDDAGLGLGLYYMHARHYSPALARFLQPDPSAAETNLYGYAGNGPTTNSDPQGMSMDRIVGSGGFGGGAWGRLAASITMKKVLIAGTVAYVSTLTYYWGGQVITRSTVVSSQKPTVTILLTKNKQTRTVIDGLRRQVEKHKQKLRANPGHESTNHWEKEILNWERQIKQLEKRLPGRSGGQ